MTGIIRYIIDLEPGQVETTAELLTDAGIPFDPVGNMIAIKLGRHSKPRDKVEENIFTGRDGEWLPQIINVYLSDTGNPGSVMPFNEMTLLAKRDLLMLATLHCDWHEKKIREINQKAWKTFQKQHPEAVSPLPEA